MTLTRHIGKKMQIAENTIRESIGIGSGVYAIKGDNIEMNLPTTLQAPYEVAKKMVGKRSFTSRYTKSKAVTMPTYRTR